MGVYLFTILLTVAPRRAIQQVQHELERNKIVDSLKKGLEQRPERDALVERKSMTFS
jgi:hypothetical protein